MSEIGRISGQLLADNLTREGSDLAFDTDLLYLDVRNRRLGINNTGPTAGFLISGNSTTDDFIVDTNTTIASLSIYNTTIQNPTGAINLTATGLNPIVYAPGWRTTSGLDIRSNEISNLTADQNINVIPTGIGKAIVNGDLDVYGNLHATGDLTFDGDITFGNSNTDTISFASDVASHTIPSNPTGLPTYSLGSSLKRWNNLYTKVTTVDDIQSGPNFYEGSINLGLRPGKSWYVSVNGNDTNDGDHQSGPFLTITKSLSVAQQGDTIFVFPGTYTETTPMTVPQGVSVKGLDIRTVKIQPSSATRNKDVFLLNGESTVEDITITGHEYDSINETGYAFRFAPNFRVYGRSPYIRNITVITAGSSVRLSTNPTYDPRGYLAGDAGRGALVDGSVANINSKEASMLFHSVTFICPGTEALVMRSGVRVEWLNSFTYYAEKGFYATQGTGRVTPEILVPSSIIDGELSTTTPTEFLDGGNATSTFSSVVETSGATSYVLKYGAELRSINSAHVYGNWAAYGNGEDVIMYLNGHNFAYVGSLYETNNDPTTADEGRQAERLNGAQIYYQSVDQDGNMRVGNVFKINGETGDIIFTGTNFQFNDGSIEFNNGSSRTYIDQLEIDTGNIVVTGNTITTLSGNLEISPTTEIVNLSAIDAFIAPVGTSAVPISTLGGIRYNSTVANYEGYAQNGVVGFYGLMDSTRSIKVTPELTPAADDKTIRMYANNDLKISITSTKTTFKNLNINNLNFAPTQLNITGSNYLTLSPTGTGVVKIKNLDVYTDTIENTTPGAITEFKGTGIGYYKIDSRAARFPAGDNNDKPLVPEVGMHRYNTEVPQFELWNGTAWIPATGTDVVSEDDMRGYTNFWSLILG
jgi:hypothetical protein